MSKLLENQETLLSFQELARVSPVKRKSDQIRRWAKQGLPNASGQRVRLEYVNFGGNMLSSKEALYRFLEELQR